MIPKNGHGPTRVWQRETAMGERTLGAYEIETAIGADVRRGKGLPVNADRERQRNAGGAIIAMVARVSRPKHDRIGTRARQVVSAPWRRRIGIPNYSAGGLRQSRRAVARCTFSFRCASANGIAQTANSRSR